MTNDEIVDLFKEGDRKVLEKIIITIEKLKREDNIYNIEIQNNYDASESIDNDRVLVVTTMKIRIYHKFSSDFEEIIYLKNEDICEKQNFDKFCDLKKEKLAIHKIDLCECIYRNFNYPVKILYDTFDLWDWD